MTRRERYALIALLTCFFVLAGLYNAVSTPFEAPDEIGHFYYMLHLYQKGRLPVVPSSDPAPNFEHEGIQPPLYYAGAALFLKIVEKPLGVQLDDADAPLESNPYTVCGQPAARANVIYLAHDPHTERFPYTGRVRALHAVRLWSSLLATASVAGVWAVARRAFPNHPAAAWLAGGLTAFTPEFLFTAGAVSNDNMVTLVSTWGVYLALRTLQDGVNWRRSIGLGMLAGLGALSKLSGALLLPLAGLTILLATVRRSERRWPGRQDWPVLIAHEGLVFMIFGVLTGWWFLRNWHLYGELTGASQMLAHLPLRDHMSGGILIRELGGLFRSWWGVFGCTLPPGSFYGFCLALAAGGLMGLLAARRDLLRAEVGLLAAWLLLMFAAYVQWNWVIHAPKGRLLYPALASVMPLLGRGWAVWTARRPALSWALLIPPALVAALIPPLVMRPPVAPPPILAGVTDVQPAHALDGRLGDDIALLGYDLNSTSFEPGQPLDLTLYWRVLAQPATHYSLAVQLVSAIPGQTATLINWNTWTGGGNYPTGFWRPGEVIADHYHLRLPDQVTYAQGWRLQAVLFDRESGARLPFTLGGNPTGDAATLALVRVGANDPLVAAPPPAHQLTPPVDFGSAIMLDGVQVEPHADSLRLTLWWRSLAPSSQDYTVFVHLYDERGELVSTADGPPLSGGFPTSLWRPGDRVRDDHLAPLPAGTAGAWQLGIGWYDPRTGVRLPAAAGGVRLPDDTLRLPVTP